jgi:tetratricopeptide (TPR) repeat protein
MTIYGLGGCGKSALVLEFAYRALAERAMDLVFWVPAISRDSFELAYREIATRLRLTGNADPNTNIKKLVMEVLSADSSGRWLMIVDNADDPTVLSGPVDSDPKSPRLVDFIPHSCRGAVLFTTRSRKAARTLTPSCVLELTDMSQGEARELLTHHIADEVLLDDATAIDQLLSILACLPLAIVQAAAFINNNKILISDYVLLFQDASADIELFSQQFEDPSRYREMHSTIAKTWHISFDQIRKQDPLAAEYLSFIACIDRINIPQSLLPLRGSAVQRVKAFGTLTGYAFITERQQTIQGEDRERFFDMHRLVHVASIAWLHGHSEWARWMHTVVDRLKELVPWGGHEGKEVWAPYLSHAVHAAGHENVTKPIDIASLLDRVGACQRSLGQFTVAAFSHRQALSSRREVLGPEHPDTLANMNNLAAVLNSQGKYEEAEAMHRRALAGQERVLRHDHLFTLTSMNNLALVLNSQGKYEEAEAMQRRALAGDERVLGHDHPSTLTSMNNLALVLNSQGKYEEAEAMHRRALAGQERVLGHDHPDTLGSMNNLALVLDSQGKYEEAEAMHRQTVAQMEKVLGHEHPDTLTSMNNLAAVLDSQGKYEEAEVMHRQTLAGQEKVLGHDHPFTLGSIYGLANILTHQRRYNESHILYDRACAGYQAVLGIDHPTTRKCHQHYANMLAMEQQGQPGLSLRIAESSASMRTGKESRLRRGLAKMGIRSSKWPARQQ